MSILDLQAMMISDEHARGGGGDSGLSVTGCPGKSSLSVTSCD
jgi:hypothetical protein